LQGRTGLSLGAVVSMNKVSSAAAALVDFTNGSLAASTVSGVHGVSVTATDDATIGSTITLHSVLETNSLSGGGTTTTTRQTAVAAAVSLNDVHGGAGALLEHANVSATGTEGVKVTAAETADITSTLSLEAHTSGIQL